MEEEEKAVVEDEEAAEAEDGDENNEHSRIRQGASRGLEIVANGNQEVAKALEKAEQLGGEELEGGGEERNSVEDAFDCIDFLMSQYSTAAASSLSSSSSLSFTHPAHEPDRAQTVAGENGDTALNDANHSISTLSSTSAPSVFASPTPGSLSSSVSACPSLLPSSVHASLPTLSSSLYSSSSSSSSSVSSSPPSSRTTITSRTRALNPIIINTMSDWLRSPAIVASSERSANHIYAPMSVLYAHFEQYCLYRGATPPPKNGNPSFGAYLHHLLPHVYRERTERVYPRNGGKRLRARYAFGIDLAAQGESERRWKERETSTTETPEEYEVVIVVEEGEDRERHCELDRAEGVLPSERAEEPSAQQPSTRAGTEADRRGDLERPCKSNHA